GFCPVISVISLTAESIAFGLSLTSPTPMLRTIFSILGICMLLLYLNFACKAGAVSFKYFSFNLAIHNTSFQSSFYTSFLSRITSIISSHFLQVLTFWPLSRIFLATFVGLPHLSQTSITFDPLTADS